MELAAALRQFAQDFPVEARLQFDPIEFPRRYVASADAEVAGLIAASLAYGRADLFKAVTARVLAVMGPRPSAFADAFARKPDMAAFRGLRYRFTTAEDIAALVAALGWMRREYGCLGDRFATLFGDFGLREALARFAAQLRTAPPVEKLLHRRGQRGVRYLLSDAASPGACKRWNLYLRWMVRGPDQVDLGLWKQVPPAALIMPLDTHIARTALALGLTRRRDLSWRTAEEITAALREVDADDPTRFDYSLCHHSMALGGRKTPCAPGCLLCGAMRAARARPPAPKTTGRARRQALRRI